MVGEADGDRVPRRQRLSGLEDVEPGMIVGLEGLTVEPFTVFTHQMGGPRAYGLLYPLGALVGAYIFARSWTRGRTVEWKGRRYTVPAASERA